jgi:hypothetical protein
MHEHFVRQTNLIHFSVSRLFLYLLINKCMESLSAARENFYVKYIDSEHVKMSRCLQKKRCKC